jgi:hypothetical protein
MVAHSPQVVVDPLDERIRALMPSRPARRRPLPGPRAVVQRVHAWLTEPLPTHTNIGRCVCGRDDRCRPF